MKKLHLTCLAAMAAILAGPAAQAGTVNANLSATYFQVLDGTDPDFNHDDLTPNVADGSSLGAHGMPVAIASFGVNDINPGTNEITWWDPALNPNVTKTGTGTISLPYDSSTYPPNSTGVDDATAFETAIYSGNFTLASSEKVAFELGSDDDAFIYVDGTLFGQNPGVHALSLVDFTSPVLSAGAHSIEVFYADRQNVGAEFALNLLSDDVVITAPGVPEPAAWALMIAGIGLAGVALRRKSVTAAA